MFLLVLIFFSGVSVYRTLLCQQIKIYEYKSNNPEGFAGATGTSGVALPLIWPKQRSHNFQISMRY